MKRNAEIEETVKAEVARGKRTQSEGALETIKTAIALGMQPPSFAGSKYFSVYTSVSSYDGDRELDDQDDIDFLGDYPTQELAEKALISWIKEKLGQDSAYSQMLDGDGNICWKTRGKTSWVPGELATTDEIIRHYFSNRPDRGLSRLRV